MLTPLDLMLRVLSYPEETAKLHAACQRMDRAYPDDAGSSTLFVWQALFATGKPVPYAAPAQQFITHLLSTGWMMIGPEFAPRAGDVFLAGDGRGNLCQLGIVAKTPTNWSEGHWFMAADHRTYPEGRLYRREIGGGEDYGRIAFWLRRQ